MVPLSRGSPWGLPAAGPTIRYTFQPPQRTIVAPSRHLFLILTRTAPPCIVENLFSYLLVPDMTSQETQAA